MIYIYHVRTKEDSDISMTLPKSNNMEATGPCVGSKSWETRKGFEGCMYGEGNTLYGIGEGSILVYFLRRQMDL